MICEMKRSKELIEGQKQKGELHRGTIRELVV